MTEWKYFHTKWPSINISNELSYRKHKSFQSKLDFFYSLKVIVKMAPQTFTQEFQTSIAPEKMFKALIIDGHHTIPKAIPKSVKSIERDAGTIRKATYTHGTQLKIKIDSVDAQNLTCKFTLIEGEMLTDKFESISYELHFGPSSHGGSIIKVKGVCLPKGAINTTTEVNAEKGKALDLFKAAEEYLLANPAICA